MNINENSMAIIILCSHLCVNEKTKPLEPKEWTQFVDILISKGIQPNEILKYSEADFINKLDFNFLQFERFHELISRSASIAFELENLSNLGINIVTRADSYYPSKLKKALGKTCPPLFYYAGDMTLVNKELIGFVGSRSITDEDIAFTKATVKKSVEKGYGIISGGAKGVDSVATAEAIANNGIAVEFISDSLKNKIKNNEIIKAIRNKQLLILSVAKPDAGFNTGFAMMRNKYIYANSIGTVIVKSDYNKGGTWSGAIDNIKSKWSNAYCWNNSSYKGNHELIHKGAFPIDIEWDINLKAAPKPNEDDEELQISLFS